MFDIQTAQDWHEVRTKNFAIDYTSSDDATAQEVRTLAITTLDDDYDRFSNFLGVSLSLPITIRIYPTEDDYNHMNIEPPPVDVQAIHSHIDPGEISLFASNIVAHPGAWQANGLTGVDYELARLLINNITDNKAPPGLLTAACLYLRAPAGFVTDLLVGAVETPNMTLRDLWESNTILEDSRLEIQDLSTVAYLVDDKGWPIFLRFLHKLATAQGYRQAFSEVYQSELTSTQDDWQKYYPFYLNGRWKANPLYAYDLTYEQRLVEGGDYTDAINRLKNAIALLQSSTQKDKLKEAQSLLAASQSGQEAGSLLFQARQSLLAGNYTSSINQAEQARQIYNQLKNVRYLPEINAYEDQAREILSLQAKSEPLISSLEKNPTDQATRKSLVDISQRLGELGDIAIQAKIRQALVHSDNPATQPLPPRTALGLILGAALLVIVRILLIHRTPPMETRL